MLLILLEQLWLSEGDISLANCCLRLCGQMTLWQYLSTFNNPLFYEWRKKIDKVMKTIIKRFFLSQLLIYEFFRASSCNTMFKRVTSNA